MSDQTLDDFVIFMGDKKIEEKRITFDDLIIAYKYFFYLKNSIIIISRRTSTGNTFVYNVTTGTIFDNELEIRQIIFTIKMINQLPAHGYFNVFIYYRSEKLVAQKGNMILTNSKLA
jgi:hypothetical protein